MPRSPTPSIGRTSRIFLQVVIVLIGVGAMALMLAEPHFEGRNAHATVFQVYFNDPFLACAYVASTAFFVALYQVFKLLRYAGRGEAFSTKAVKALRTTKYCAIFLVGCIAAAEVYLVVAVRGKDDITGGVAMGLLGTFVCVVVAAAAAVFERLLQGAVILQSENDLTV